MTHDAITGKVLPELNKACRRPANAGAALLLMLMLMPACGGGGGADTGVAGDPPAPPPPPPSAGVLQLDAASYSVDESSQTVSFTVTRTGGTAGEVSIAIATGDGTALAGQDYGAMTTTATFADGDSGPKSGNVIIFDDNEHEPDETLNLMLSNVTGGATVGTQASAVVTIVSDDPRRITVSGTIEGLSGDGLALRNNGGDEVPVGASETTFVFPQTLVAGDRYDVSVAVQPWAPAQHCEVTNGSGTAGDADVTDLRVTCVELALQSVLINRRIGNQQDLLVVSEDGSSLVVLADTVANENFQGFAGERLVYTAAGEVYSILPDGSGRILLTDAVADESFGGIAEGAGLVFFERRAGTFSDEDLYVIGADGHGLTALATTADDEEFAGFAMHRDGPRVIYSRTVGGQDDLWSVRPDGSDPIAIAAAIDFEEFAGTTPEGRVLFHRVAAGDRDLYSVEADGTGLVALASGAGEHYFLDLLEGERLIYRHEATPMQYDLYSVNADGTEPAALANTTVSEWFDGVTASGRIVFRRFLSEHSDLYAVDPDGTSQSTLAATDFNEYFAGALPDGRVLYIRSDPSQADLNDIFAVNDDGSGTVQLTDTPEFESVPFRAYVAGNRFVFVRDMNGRDDLFSMAFDGSDERRLTDTPDVDENLYGITASGGLIYDGHTDGQSDVGRIGVDGNGFAVLGSTGEPESVRAIF